MDSATHMRHKCRLSRGAPLKSAGPEHPAIADARRQGEHAEHQERKYEAAVSPAGTDSRRDDARQTEPERRHHRAALHAARSARTADERSGAT